MKYLSTDKDSVELLKQLRMELRSCAEGRATELIDETIAQLESSKKQSNQPIDPIEILLMFGKVLELLPTIAKAIEWLKQCH